MKILLPLLLLISADPGSIGIEGVPFVRQDSHWCGPASLASVLGYYGLATDQDAIAEAVYTDKLKGALISDLENFARAQGFQTRLGQGTAEDIRAVLRAKRPVIVLVDLGLWVFSQSHYLVVTGYTEKGFIANTGYESGKTFPYAEFEKIWVKKGSVYLLVWR
ncbi:MAG: C39 family peptidase [Desulfobacterota bacterium]|nr:C39 family peptidase [Thermodesulfobacteriota bacterium]